MKGHCESYYKYEVRVAGRKPQHFKEIAHIIAEHKVSKSTIYRIINGLPVRRWSHLSIKKVRLPARELADIVY